MKKLLSSVLSLALAALSAQPAFASFKSVAVTPSMGASAPVLTVPTLPAPTLGAQQAVAIPSIVTPQTAIGAAPALQNLAVQTAPEAKAPEAALANTYDRAHAANPGENGPVSANMSAPTGSSPSGLQPSSPNNSQRQPDGPRRPFNSQRGAANVKVIGIIAGAVLAVALIIGLIIHHGNQKDKLWSNSPAAAEVVQVEKARRANDAETLFKIAGEAQKRAADRAEKIADAKSRRSDKVDGRSIDEEQSLKAFDELAAARATLNANEVSSDANRRVGKVRPETWNGKLNELESEAKATGFEGRIGNELDSLQGEIGVENKSLSEIGGKLADFEKQVPSFGGAALKEQRQKAQADLAAFQKEVTGEFDQHSAKMGAVRGRIYDRLQQGNAEFRQVASRRDALAKLEAGPATTAADRASSVETELRNVADKLKIRDDANKEAVRLSDEAKTHDAEAKRLERAEVKVPVKDPQTGQQARDANGNLLWTIEIQDLSGPEKEKAAQARRDAQAKLDEARNAAIAARDAAVRAGRDRDDLVRDADLLRNDETLKGLRVASVPSSVPGVSVYVVWRWVDLDRQDADFFLEVITYDQANELRAKFSTVKGGFDETKRAVGEARGAQDSWLSKKVTDELERQKKSGF